MKKFWVLILLFLPIGLCADQLDGLLQKYCVKPILPVAESSKEKPPAHISKVFPSFFYVEERGQLLQMARVEVEKEGSGLADIEVMAEVPGGSAYATRLRLAPGRTSFTIKIPAMLEPGEMRLYLTANQKVVDVQTFDWPKARLYKVYVTFVSHLDLGYTGTQEQVFKKRDAITARAIQFAEQTKDWPEDSRFRWTMEGAWELKHFLETHPEKLDGLKKMAQEGRLEVTSKLVHMHSETAGYEELFRENYYAQREAGPLLGIPVLTAMENDVDGFTWGEVSVLSSCGVKYFSLNPNSFYRGGNILHATKFPQAFWWQGPDNSQLLTWRSKFSYSEASWLYKDYGAALPALTKLLAGYEREGYQYDAIHITRSGSDYGVGNDNSWPKLQGCETIREWNKHFAYPHLISATPVMFFSYMEKNFSQQIPVARGDMPDWWADGVISDAASEAKSRDLHHQLFKAEALASMASLLSPDYKYPKDQINDAFYKNLLFDEHTFGASLQADPKFRKIFKLKKAWLEEAKKETLEVQDKAGQSILSGAKLRPFDEIRSDLKISNSTQIENNRFLLSFDKRLGLVSIKDKKLGRELLDGPLGQFIYRKQGLFVNSMDIRVPQKIHSLEIFSGPLYSEARIKITDPANPRAKIIQTIQLYHDADFIDVSNESKNYVNLPGEARYFAFPFKVPDFEIWVETPYGKMRPYYDQFPDFAKFYTVSHSIELKSKSDNFSIIWSTKEAPMVELGEITKKASWDSQAFWPLFYKPGVYPWNPDKPTIYSEIMNNFQNTNFPATQAGTQIFSYRITVVVNQSNVARIGWELSGQTIPDSWIKLSPDNAMITEFKKAEDGDGYIVRLYEAEGKPAKAHLEFPLFKLTGAWMTDGVERVQSQITVKSGAMDLDLGPLEVKTVKLQFGK